MGTDYRLARVNGRFFVRWKAEDGRWQRRSLGTDDNATAKARLGEFKRQIDFQQHAGETLTVAAVYHAYVADRKAEGKTAVPRMKDAWKRLEPTFGPLIPAHINKTLCRQYTADRKRSGAGAGTVHVELGYLRAAMRFARREGWITMEPVVVLPTKPAPKDHHLTRDEAQALIEAAEHPHLRLFIILALATAARSQALLDLTWDRVDLDRRQIRLRKPQKAETAKGRATVPINETALQALLEARRGAIGDHVIEWAGHGVGSVKKGVSAAAARAGVKATPHVLRHTAAVWMAEAGTPMAEIAQYLGHTNPATTFRVYARYSPDYLRKAASALELPEIQFSLRRNGPRSPKQAMRERSK